MNDNTFEETVNRYMAAWNEPEAAARQALLEQCWSDDGVYFDPRVHADRSGRTRPPHRRDPGARAGARLEFMSGVDAHHNVVRFLWRLVHADGSRGEVSIDFGEIGLDGRLARIIGFFGAPPSLP